MRINISDIESYEIAIPEELTKDQFLDVYLKLTRLAGIVKSIQMDEQNSEEHSEEPEQQPEVEVLEDDEPVKVRKERKEKYSRDQIKAILSAHFAVDRETRDRLIKEAGMSYGTFAVRKRDWIKNFRFTKEELMGPENK